MISGPPSSSVLCVDDNRHVADALRALVTQQRSLRWIGWLADAAGLVERVEAESPDVVLLDLDMPGPDPFDVLGEMTSRHAGTKVVVFTGHLRKDLIDRAIEVGAWGYVSKNEGPDALMNAIALVLRGEFALSRDVRTVLSCGV